MVLSRGGARAADPVPTHGDLPDDLERGGFDDGEQGRLHHLADEHHLDVERVGGKAPPSCLIRAFAISPDGRLAASNTHSEVVLHHASGSGGNHCLPVPAYAGSIGSATLAFSADATRVALHTAVGSVVVWNLATLREELRALGMDW